MRPRKRGCCFFNETRLSDFYMSETRLRPDLTQISVSFTTRPRREQTFNKEKDFKFDKILFRNYSSKSGRDRDETE